jgi:REP element-mobilizing transposase RayT
MEILYPVHWPQFYTATCYEWLPLLANDKYKNIIINSLQFMVTNKRIELNAFVIMNNHIHVIWQAMPGYDPAAIQLSFMRYPAQQIKFELLKDDPGLIEKCKVNKADREYQIWKRESLGVELFTEAVFKQKPDYINYNPVAAGLCKFPEEYYYSSALFYEKGIDHFNMLTHYMG